MPFKPGAEWTGNRHGRPRVGETVADYIRGLAGLDGRQYVDKLHALATEPHTDTKARIQAIEILFERGWGRPAQELDIHDSRDDYTGLTNDELAARATALVARLQHRSDDDGDEPSQAH